MLHLYVNTLLVTQQSGSNSFGTTPFTGSGVERADLSHFGKFLLTYCLFFQIKVKDKHP